VRTCFSEEIARERFVTLIQDMVENFAGYERSTQVLLDVYYLFLESTSAGSVTTDFESKAPEIAGLDNIAITATSSLPISPLAPPPIGCAEIRRRIAYCLVPQRANWIGLDVLVRIYQQPITGTLKLRVFLSTDRLLRETSADLARARDNDWLSFRFAPIANSHRQAFILEFNLINGGSQTSISFCENVPSQNKLHYLFESLLNGVGLQSPEIHYIVVCYTPDKLIDSRTLHQRLVLRRSIILQDNLDMQSDLYLI